MLIAALLIIAARQDFWIKPAGPPAAMNEPPAQAETVSKPAGIVRSGSVVRSFVVPVNSGFFGRVSEVYVQEGQAVKAGQPLFKLEASLGGGEASAQAANPRFGAPSGQDSYDNTLKEYNRLKRLYELGAIPRRQLENAAARLQQAQASEQAAGSVGAALSGPVTVTAPVDGIVSDLVAAAGSTVQAGQQVLALGSGETVEVVVSLEQKELYLVQLGTPVAIEAEGQTVMGQVLSIFPEVRENKISFFLAHVKLNNPPAGLLKPGMAVNVRIDTGT